MVSFVGKVTKESVVDVLAEVRAAPEPITAATLSDIELAIVNFHVVSRAAPEVRVPPLARQHRRGRR